MASSVELDDGSVLIGDPVLPEGRHWCWTCLGDGAAVDGDGSYAVCYDCGGQGIDPAEGPCIDTACRAHSTLHPES